MAANRLLPLLLLLAAPAGAQPAVTSAGPEQVAVTIYRDPDREPEESFDLDWLDGYALITETRTVALPAGEADLRFEGVAGGIVPESAIVAGLQEEVVEKNQDAHLLSPASLLDSSLGRRVRIRRTDLESGQSKEMAAVIRSGADGAVVLETRDGVEALRCTGLPETIVYDRLPEGLSARPTLSVRVRSRKAVQATVTLSYLATGFDWQANYIAELSPDHKRMDLFAWMTLANGDETGFRNAEALAVAGKVERDEDDEGGEPVREPIKLKCWPQGTTTSDLVEYQPPPPAPLPSANASMEVDVLTSASPMYSVNSMAVIREALAGLQLYRIPERVTVAANSQKQVALLSHGQVPVDLVYRFSAGPNDERDGATPTLVVRNREQDGLGIPLPGGTVEIFETLGGRRVLVGRSDIRDHAVGEYVEFPTGESTDVVVSVVRERDTPTADDYRVAVSNAKPHPIRAEISLDAYRFVVEPIGASLTESRRGWPMWTATVPANGRAELRYRLSPEGRDE